MGGGRPEEIVPAGVPAPRSPLWRRAASSPLCFKRWYLRRNTHTLPGPPLRRGPAHGPVRPLAVGVKPGARELGRREPFRVRPFSGGSLARIMQVFWGTFAPPVSAFIPRSFPSCGICPPAVVIAPRVETSDPGQRCGPFPSLDIRGKGAPGLPRGSMPSYTRGRFSAPSPPFLA